jgi:error-prone DNA polymerase
MTRPYAELRCKTNFSFLRAASHPEELVVRAAELGHAALAVTDVNTLAGIVRAHAAAKAAGLKLIVGAEITPHDAPAVLLYAPDRRAYGRLSRLITCGRRAAPKGECYLSFADVAAHADGLIAAVVPPGKAAPPDELERYRDVFAGRCYLAAALHHGPRDAAELRRLAALARRLRLPLVATNDVHYHDPARRPLHDVLTAIRHGVTVARLGARRFPNAERHLKPPARGDRPHHRACRPLHLHARRAALRVPRGAVPARADAGAAPRPADLGRGAQPLPGGDPGEGGRPARARAEPDRGAALRGVLPDRV